MRYSDKQFARASAVNLKDFLISQGEEVIKSGQEYRWKKHDSVTIRDNQYFQHSREEGGYPVNFVMKFWNVSFPAAVKMLIHEDPEEPTEVDLPPRNSNNESIKKYLSSERGLDVRLIDRFIAMEDLYEDAVHHNAVFVGKDPQGIPRYAHLRGTTTQFRQDLKGSNKAYGFAFRGGNDQLYVFEAPIDLLSFINLYPEHWKENNYLSLGGVASKALGQFLRDQPTIKQIHLCLDADDAGDEGCQRIASSIPKDIAYDRYRPFRKDWNDVLLHQEDFNGKDTYEVISLSEETHEEVPCLQSMTMEELFETTFPPKTAIISSLLYSGTYIFAGAPKVGKSFLMLQFAYHVATGTPLWGFSVLQSGVLYLALEDDYSRLQERLYRMFGVETTSSLHLAINANTLADGLVDQISGYVRSHSDIRLIIIDTLQKVRDGGVEGYSYANDYESITKLKQFSDHTGVCILIVHLTRKMESSDPYEKISGTNGLLGAADGGFILSKDRRSDNSATLEVVGRDQEELTITLRKDRESLAWNLEEMATPPYVVPPDPLILSIAQFMNGRDQWAGIASELLEQLPEVEMAANAFVRKLNVLSGELYNQFGISYIPNQRTSDRKTFLLMADKEKQQLLCRNDDMTVNDGISDTSLNDDIPSSSQT